MVFGTSVAVGLGAVLYQRSCKAVELLSLEGGSPVDLAETLEKIRGDLGDSANLSYAGSAAYETLRHKHGKQHDKCWNVTTGRTVGTVRWTPKDPFDHACRCKLQMKDTPEDVPADKVAGKKAHNQDLPGRMGELIAKTEYWCDVTSLDPPDGMFMTAFTNAITKVAQVWNIAARAIGPPVQ